MALDPVLRLLRGIRWLDWIFALGLTFTAVVESSLLNIYGHHPLVLCFVLIHWAMIPVALLRTRYPVGAMVMAYVLLTCLGTITVVFPGNLGVSPILIVAPVMLYTVTRRAHPMWGRIAVLAAILGSFISPAATPNRAMIPVHIAIVTTVYLIAGHIRQVEDTARRTTQADYAYRIAQAQSRAQVAAEAERTQIAREIHDIVAHSLAVISVHAGTGLAVGTTAQMRESLEVIRTTSTSALTEVRGLVELLREPDSVPTMTGDLTTLPRILERVRQTGAQIHDTLPDARQLAQWQAQWEAPVRLAVLRIVQEGLTNVMKHGGDWPSAHCSVTSDTRYCSITITNPASETSDDSGFGLAGLQERAHTVGGTIAFEHTDGMFTLNARIPIERM